MDEKTLTALQGSIAKWEAIVKGAGPDLGWENCPLCTAFYEVTDEEDPEAEWARDGCVGCPVAQRVNQCACGGTPYEKWSTYMLKNERRKFDEKRTVFDDKSRELAQLELDFLRSLLPAGA